MATIRQIRCGMVNCWLIMGDGGSVLVDTAVPKYKDDILEAVDESDVQLILHTHGHTDHTGCTAYLAEKLNVPVAMHRDDLELIETGKMRKMNAHTFLGQLIRNGSERSMYKVPPFKPDILLEEGASLREYGVNGEIVGLPGHTAGSIGLRVDDCMITGDAVFNILRPTCARLYEDKENMLRSVEKILQSGAQTLMAGHGKAFSASELSTKKAEGE